MENKELPSAKEFIKSRFIYEPKIFSQLEACELMEEYAQLVTEYRVKQALESANNRMIDQAFKLKIHKQLIESLEMAILNA